MNFAGLTIAQLLEFNSVKHKRVATGSIPSTVMHATPQETPVPTYIGLMLHAHTRKRELIDRLAHKGFSISYDRVLSLSAQLENNVSCLYHQEQVVCLPKMRGGIVTTAAVDNIDHNPSSTTATQSSHGTAISLMQNPAFSGAEIDRTINTVGGTKAKGKVVDRLPHYYTYVPPITNSIKNTPVPPTSVTTLCNRSSGFEKHADEERGWLEHTKLSLQELSTENTS